jgi:hypothetical protein
VEVVEGKIPFTQAPSQPLRAKSSSHALGELASSTSWQTSTGSRDFGSAPASSKL